MTSGWRDTTLGALCAPPKGLQTGPFGSQLKAEEYTGDPAGVPVIMPRDLVDGGVSTAEIARVSPAKAATLERHRVRAGDLLFARRGEIGRCALIGPAEEGWLCGTGCLRARLAPGAEPRFLLHHLRWEATIVWLARRAVGQTMLNLSTAILARLPLRLPPVAEQRRIAHLLDTAAAAVRAAAAVAVHVPALRASVMRSLLARGGTLRPLGELADFVNGCRFHSDDWTTTGLPIIRIQNLNGGGSFHYFAGLPRPEWEVEPGELLFAWAGTRGKSFGAFLWPGPRGVLNQHIFRVRPHAGIEKLWLYETLRQLTRQIEERAHGFKDDLVHVRRRDVLGLRVAVPSVAEQRAIVERSAELAELEERERHTLDHARTVERGLRHNLFSGRLAAGC